MDGGRAVSGRARSAAGDEVASWTSYDRETADAYAQLCLCLWSGRPLCVCHGRMIHGDHGNNHNRELINSIGIYFRRQTKYTSGTHPARINDRCDTSSHTHNFPPVDKLKT